MSPGPRLRPSSEARCALPGAPVPTEIHAAEGGGGATVVIVSGFPDAGYERVTGSRFRRSPAVLRTCDRLAAWGINAVAYSAADPVRDGRSVMEYLAGAGPDFGVDPSRVGIWAMSGNAPTALGLLLRGVDHGIRCAALLYPFMFETERSTEVADAAAKWGFAYPIAGHSTAEVQDSVPVLVVRAGMDSFPGLLPSVDHFVSVALRENMPVTVINHASGLHGFDTGEESAGASAVLDQVRSFLQRHLLVG